MEYRLSEDQQAIVDAAEQICADFPLEYWRGKDKNHEFPHEFFSAVASGGYWLHVAASGPTATDERGWARRVFAASLVCLLALCVLMAIDFR